MNYFQYALRRHLIGMASLFLIACANKPIPYTGVPFDGSARLDFDVRGTTSLAVIPDGDNCEQAYSFTPENHPLTGRSKSLRLPGEKTAAIFLTWTVPAVSSCWVLFSFTPKQGGEYLVVGNKTSGGCQANIIPRTPLSAEGFVVERKRWSNGIPPVCVPLK